MQRDKAKVKIVNARYYQKHKCAVRTSQQHYYTNHKDMFKTNYDKWVNTHPNYNSEVKRLARYGISFSDFSDMLKSQKGKCKICAKPFKSRRSTHVDHNHSTNEVRALLCNRCNSLLGMCGESPTILRKAIKYLDKYN